MPLCTQAEARAEIQQLVSHFHAHRAQLVAAPEAQIENNYIRPLFSYLNWNVSNAGLARPDWEFVVQPTTTQGKRPDYVLQLDGQHLLVMDAKQVKYDMHDPRWINQVYAYAYSTQNYAPARKIDFAVLTDFEGFVLLDCTLYAGDPKVVNNFRVLDWQYQHYVREFDTLWELFERENMRAAARARGTDQPTGLWARALSPKKVKANRIPPDKAFLMEMDDDKSGWRVRLAKDMKKLNPQAGGDLITAAVQLWIDRLIFVKALSDREIEDDYLTRLAETVEQAGLAESDTGWFTACRKIFDQLNTFYNGSIFEPRPELEAVAVSNKVVREILRALQPENSPYNFSVLPVEILGTIYERFLGRVVRATEKQVKIEDKPEVRKAGGVYYTPQYIVDYIVQNTVGKRLAECKTPDDVARLKILDPACGSGSFLLGAYSALIEWHARYFGARPLTLRDRASAYYDAEGNVHLTARLKRQILLNNIFGVDIDPQAVEVTRFSLSLKALEDTRHDELYQERDLFKQIVLPDLRQNIQCGNSLIGCDYSDDAQERIAVKAFDWETQFAQVFAPTLPRRAGEGREGAGFDCVIGNPPYIRIQTMKEWSPLEVEAYKRLYAAGSGNYDIYVVFVERGLSLLNLRGRLGFILPHKFFNAQYGEALRELLAQGRHLAHVVHFGDQQVFEGATTYTCLMFLDKAGGDECQFVKVDDLSAWRASQTFEVSQGLEGLTQGTIPAANITAAEWNFAVGPGAALFERLSKMPLKLGDVTDIFVGLQTSADDVFIMDLVEETPRTLRLKSKVLDAERTFEKGMLFPLVSGTDVNRYRKLPERQYILFPYKVSNEQAELIDLDVISKHYPKTAAYLLENKRRLEERERGKFKGRDWYRFGRNQNIGIQERVKLCVPRLVDRLYAAFDAEGDHFLDNVDVGGITLKPDCEPTGHLRLPFD